MPEFEGRSENGNLQEALKDAIDRAVESGIRADQVVTYQLKKIRGICGGVAGFNRVTVTIDAEVH